MSRKGEYPAQGDTIIYLGTAEVTALTGDPVAEMKFTDLNGSHTYTYRAGASLEALKGRDFVEVPFTIPLEMVDRVRDAIKGKEFFIKTPLWFSKEGKSRPGRKFVKVTILDVLPANAIYPFMVVFADERGEENAVYMSTDAGARWSPREFPSIFDMQDPRRNYPQISDENWARIKDSKVAPGMTKTEVTLALGSPAAIDRGATHSSSYERWRYSEGMQVVFEDGLVIRTTP